MADPMHGPGEGGNVEGLGIIASARVQGMHILPPPAPGEDALCDPCCLILVFHIDMIQNVREGGCFRRQARGCNCALLAVAL